MLILAELFYDRKSIGVSEMGCGWDGKDYASKHDWWDCDFGVIIIVELCDKKPR